MNSHLLPYPYNQTLKKPRFSLLYRTSAFVLGRIHDRINPHVVASRRLPPITVICLSDTHNATPAVPNGDILIHAGDLTQHGTFDELQAQLDWLKSLPHAHKVVIAGNHDLLLDESFAQKFPRRAQEGNSKRRADLDWGNIIYLQDSASLIIHRPPLLHGDADKKGDGYLLKELRRVKPELVVCGHVHDGRGTDRLVHDGVQVLAEEIRLEWKGFLALVEMAFMVIWSWLKAVVGRRYCRITYVVNAAVAPSEKDKDKTPKSPIEVRI